jgi:L-lactate dehydrogenase
MTQYPAASLRQFAHAALAASGLAPDRAAIVGDVLLEGDLLGHTTHGLALLAPYAEELLAGRMAATGDPAVISDRGAAIAWDGMRLPGPWLVQQGIALASARAEQYGTATLAIGRSHHIACLAAYLEPVARSGKMLLLLSSDPGVAAVAPFGGKTPVFTPNPIAAGWPTQQDPVLLDISTSLTTMGMVGRQHRAGAPLDHPWLIDAEGRATTDPAAVAGGGKGALLPLGGLEAGHKGFGLGLMVEALTSALAGAGRGGTPDSWGASVMIQVIDPAAFGGRDAFAAETQAVAESCRAAAPIDPAKPVRMPGAAALARKARQLAEGVQLHEGIPPALEALAQKLGLAMPESLDAPMGGER